MTVRRRVVIVGGGVAGIAAALRAAESGWIPTLVESRTMLGGRATSFTDVRSGLELDNAQHVVMGCCTNILELYERLGVLDDIEWHRTLHFARGGGAADALTIGALPAPLHYAVSFARMKLFTRSEKWQICCAFAAILRGGPKDRLRWSGQPFSAFLTQQRQSPNVIELFWEPVVLSACNMRTHECEATHALKVFDEGMLAHRFAGMLGTARIPLVRLYERTSELLSAVGGELKLRTSAKAFAFDGARVTALITTDDRIEAQAFVSAVGPGRLAKLCSQTLREHDQRLQHLERFSFSPILGVHVALKRRLMQTANLALPNRATHWLFAYDAAEGAGFAQRIEAVVSAATDWIGLSEDEITQRVCTDLAWAFPDFKRDDVLWSRPVLERHATFASTVGIDALRPRASVQAGDARGGVSNLFLAGEWTDTGWPSTMEGAARSGFAAAAACCGGKSIAADLPPSALVRFARAL